MNYDFQSRALATSLLRKEIKMTGEIKARSFAMVGATQLYERGYIKGALSILWAAWDLWRADFVTLKKQDGLYAPMHPLDWCEASGTRPQDYSRAPVVDKHALWRLEYAVTAIEALVNLQHQYEAYEPISEHIDPELLFHNDLHLMRSDSRSRTLPVCTVRGACK